MARPRGPIRAALGLLAAGTLIATSLTMATTESAHAATPAQAIADAMQPGWNLGNSFDAIGADETAWGNPVVSQALITNIKAQGFNSIRIPASWGQHEGAAPDYTIDPTFLARVQTVVDQALAADLYVVLDLHHDSWQWVTNLPTQHDTVLAQFNATWTQLAAAFNSRSNKLILEPINEQSFTGSSGDPQSYQLMDELNRSFYSIVRGTGGNNATRPLLLPTLYTNGDQARLDALAATVTSLNDPNILTTIHYYGYWPFSTNIAGTTSFDATTQKDLTDAFDRAYTTFISQGIPVVIGEYGLLGFDKSLGSVEHGEVLKYFEFFGYYAKLRGLTTMLWDNGQHFDRTNFVWRDADLWAQIQSSWSGRSGTSTDQIFVPKSQPVTDESITLNLNGTTFTGLSNGSTPLVQGTDYTVSGSTLTLPAATVTTLVGDRSYGTNATLTATFSAGVPWKINVITADTPVLSSATGTSTSLVIPAQFNGDRLATMEATYADGSGAGPQNWTTYKEFDYAFSPNYTANTITLPENFFRETNDGTVNLKFHFWSGAVITYTLVKSGASVTGTGSGGGTTTTTTTTTEPSTTTTTTTTEPTTTTTTTEPTTTTTTTTTQPTTTTSRPTTTTTTTRRTTTTTTRRTTTTTTRRTTTTTGPSSCTATLTVAAQWPGGYVAGVKVSAGTALKSWKVKLTLPSGTSVQTVWNGSKSGTTGTVTVSNTAYNGKLPAGGSTEFGLQGAGTIAGTTVTCAAA